MNVFVTMGKDIEGEAGEQKLERLSKDEPCGINDPPQQYETLKILYSRVTRVNNR